MTTPALVKSADLKRMAAIVAKPLVKLIEVRKMQRDTEAGRICWIYFLWCEDLNRFKIGKTNNPERRCKEVSGAIGMRLDVMFAFQAPEYTERVIHRILKPHRQSHEWFSGDPEVDQLCECFEDFDLEFGPGNPILTAEDVEFVIDDWANSYGRGRTSKTLDIGENQ